MEIYQKLEFIRNLNLSEIFKIWSNLIKMENDQKIEFDEDLLEIDPLFSY